MNRIFSIAILVSFLISTVGVVAGSYCCKKMSAIEQKSCCKSSSKGCCEKEVKLLKLKDDYVSSAFHQTFKVVSFSLAGLFNEFETDLTPAFANSEIRPTDHSPPRETSSILPFIQSFLI